MCRAQELFVHAIALGVTAGLLLADRTVYAAVAFAVLCITAFGTFVTSSRQGRPRRSGSRAGSSRLGADMTAGRDRRSQPAAVERGYRTAPSAGALYPLEVNVEAARGVFHYRPRGHRLERLSQRDARGALHQAALSQAAVRVAPCVFVITAEEARTRRKYGRRAQRYVHLEAGHAAQNLLLQATALGLGGVPIGAFSDVQVQSALGCPRAHEPLYLIPVGHPR